MTNLYSLFKSRDITLPAKFRLVKVMFFSSRWRHSTSFWFSGLPKHCRWLTVAMKLRLLLLERKAMRNIDSILKSRDITLLTKVHLVKGVVFPVVMYGCESWTIKKDESRRIDAFELWCWRRLLSLLDCKEIQPVHPKGNQF